ncbi:transposase IS4, partial [mine drainage metagenome]
PQKRRARKKTLAYLGRVTPQGIVPPRPKGPLRYGGALDAGNLLFLDRFVEPLQTPLQAAFPHDWQNLLCAAALKLCYLEPFSRLQLRYETSLAKRRWPEAHMGDDALSRLVPRIGAQWAAQRDVFRTLAQDEKHMAIDLSHVFSEAQEIPWLEYGHNGDDAWRPQLQMVLCWGATTHRPGYLQLLSGATHSAQTLAHLIREIPLQEVIAVLDKGFWSPENVEAFEDASVHYAMALRRDLPIV